MSHCWEENYDLRQICVKETCCIALHCTASCICALMLQNQHCELGLLYSTACRNVPRRKLRDVFRLFRKNTFAHFRCGMSNFCLETNIVLLHFSLKYAYNKTYNCTKQKLYSPLISISYPYKIFICC